MHFNLFDIITLSVFCGSILLGMYRGLIVTSINIGNFILTIFLTILLTPLSEEIVREHVRNHLVATILSIVVSYLLSNFAANWISKRLKEIVENYTKNFIDRVLGLWLGAIRGYFICIMLFSAIAAVSSSSYVGAKNYWEIINNTSEEQYPKWLKSAALYAIMNGSFNKVYDTLSGSFIERYLEGLNMPSQQVEKAAGTAAQDTSTTKQERSNSVDEIQQQLLETH